MHCVPIQQRHYEHAKNLLASHDAAAIHLTPREWSACTCLVAFGDLDRPCPIEVLNLVLAAADAHAK